MQSPVYNPRNPKSPLDIDIDNIFYNETYDEDLEYYGMEEIIESLNNTSDLDILLVDKNKFNVDECWEDWKQLDDEFFGKLDDDEDINLTCAKTDYGDNDNDLLL